MDGADAIRRQSAKRQQAAEKEKSSRVCVRAMTGGIPLRNNIKRAEGKIDVRLARAAVT